MSRVGLTGVIDIELRVAELTVRVADPEIVPKVAVICVGPTATAVARPPGLVIVTTEVSEDVQVT